METGKKPVPVEIMLTKITEMKMEKLAAYLNDDSDDRPSDVLQIIDIIFRTCPMLYSRFVPYYTFVKEIISNFQFPIILMENVNFFRIIP